MGGPSTGYTPAWYSSYRVTPAEVTRICEKHLTAVLLDWSNVSYNIAWEDAARATFAAMGVKLLRITDYNFDPTSSLASDLTAAMTLNPNIILTGGSVSPQQLGPILAPAVAEHKIIGSVSVAVPGWQIGLGQKMVALVGYNYAEYGIQLANAIHAAYPNGVTLGYIHWISTNVTIGIREQAFLNQLKKYPNIKVVWNGTGPPNANSTQSGFTQATAGSAEAYAVGFLQSHPNIQLLYAPWEDPPGVGEIAAIKSLHLQNKVGIVTMDMAQTGAQSLSHSGVVKAEVTNSSYQYGYMLAIATAAAAIGVKEPPFGLVDTWAVTPTNVAASWEFAHGPNPNVACPPGDC